VPTGTIGSEEDAPRIWQALLGTELSALDAGSDTELIGAAQALLRLVDAVGSRSGRYDVEVRNSQGVLIGDYGTQDNTYVHATTYVHSQIVQHVETAADSTTAAPPSKVSGSSRLDAARTLAQVDSGQGKFAYQKIAADSAVADASRMEAASILAKMDRDQGKLAYQEIAVDSTVAYAYRMDVARIVAKMDSELGELVYRKIAQDSACLPSSWCCSSPAQPGWRDGVGPELQQPATTQGPTDMSHARRNDNAGRMSVPRGTLRHGARTAG
jgi:hypothetical protein